MRIVLIGPPGSGKGTQAKRVATHYQVPHVTVAGALADIAAEDSELGRLVKETIETNRVSDDLIIAVLRVRLTQADAANGFVLDGFPRTVTQAETLEAVLDGVGRPIDVVLLVDVDPDELMERLVGRLTCEGCGAVYNLVSARPKQAGVCDRCGAALKQRADDTSGTVLHRLDVYRKDTAPLVAYYEHDGLLQHVDAAAPAEAVYAALARTVGIAP